MIPTTRRSSSASSALLGCCTVETVRKHRTARGWAVGFINETWRILGAYPPLSAKLKVINHLPRLFAQLELGAVASSNLMNQILLKRREAHCMICSSSSRKYLICKYHFIQYAAAILHGHTVHTTSLGGAETLKVCCTPAIADATSARLKTCIRRAGQPPRGAALSIPWGASRTAEFHVWFQPYIPLQRRLRRAPKYGRNHTSPKKHNSAAAQVFFRLNS